MTTGRINQVFHIKAPLPWHRLRFNNTRAPATQLSSLSLAYCIFAPPSCAKSSHTLFKPSAERWHCKTSSSSPLPRTPQRRCAQDPQRKASISSLPGTSQPPPPAGRAVSRARRSKYHLKGFGCAAPTTRLETQEALASPPSGTRAPHHQKVPPPRGASRMKQTTGSRMNLSKS